MNQIFTAYRTATGEILFAGDAHDPLAIANGDISVLLGCAYANGWIANGAYHALPTQPTQHHVFDYTTKQWVDPRTPETEWPLVREKRNRLLTASDWTQLPDVPLTTKEAWATYRQQLRDITLQPDPFNIAWPVAPG